MSKNKYLLITVDTEALPNRAVTDHVRRLIWGEHPRGRAGIREICAVGNEFGVKHVFFVDMCGAYARRDETEEVVLWLDRDGQDVEMHAHPEYLPESFWPEFGFKYRPRFMNQYADDKADFVIGHFGGMLSGILGRPLRAFRAGSFRWNAGTIRALARHGIPLSFDNSVRAVYNGQCIHSLSTNAPFRWENGVVEVPVSEKDIMPFLHRNWRTRLQYPQSIFCRLDPWWASFLPGGVDRRAPFLVFLLHSWSLMYWDENGHGVYRDDARITGYRGLLKRLVKEYDVITTADLLDLFGCGEIPLTHEESLAMAELPPKKTGRRPS